MNLETAKKLKSEKKLHLVGDGAQMMTDIKMLALSFSYYHDVDQKKARELLLSAIHEYLAVINKNEQIQPYLYNRPFTANNVEIRIFVRKPDHSDIDRGKICAASALEGAIRYDIRDPETDRLRTIATETYEEALSRAQF
ncbi:MAG: hypothetical protein HYX48_06835 [Chlamydiales bacterium]|nr:hypothetical protein [Chlamydiales bacterium]